MLAIDGRSGSGESIHGTVVLEAISWAGLAGGGCGWVDKVDGGWSCDGSG